MAKTETTTIARISALTFGIEIETTRITRRRAADAIAEVIGGTVSVKSAHSDSFWTTGTDGRKWAVVTDGSIGWENAEVVSPVLRYSDMTQLQEIVRALRAAGAQVDSRCGIHVHVGTQGWDRKAITRLASYWHRQEFILQAMFNSNTNRFANHGWARPLTQDFVASIENGTIRADRVDTRYRALNLQNCITRGGNVAAATVEFRSFDATLHAGKIKAYVQFCLAMAAKAVHGRWSQRSADVRRPLTQATAKYDARTIMLRLNLSGEEFKTCRLHMTKHLSGVAASANTNGRRDRRAHQARVAASFVGPVQLAA